MDKLDKYYFDRWSQKDDWSKVGPTKMKRLQNLFFFVEKYSIKKNANVLDYGCGSGWIFPYLKAAGFFLFNGYDVTPTSLSVVKDKYPFVKNVWAGTGEVPSIVPTDCFDLCTCIEVIEHVPSKYKLRVLLDVHRVIKPKGFLYITTPNGKYFKTGIKKEEMQPIEEWIKPRELMSLLNKSGFNVLSKGSIVYNPYLSNLHKIILYSRIKYFLKKLGVLKYLYSGMDKGMFGLSTYYFCQKI